MSLSLGKNKVPEQKDGRLGAVFRGRMKVSLFLVLAFEFAQSTTLKILHTNDIHSDFSLFAKISTVKRENPDSLLVDSGDYFSGGDPLFWWLNGEPVIKIMNNIGYTATALGNHEINDLGLKILSERLNQAEFPILCANLTTDYPLNYKPYIIKQVKGSKVGIVGLCVSDPFFYAGVDVRMCDPIEKAKEIVKILKDRADIIIALSHLGREGDLKLAKKVPEIDLIIGGHDYPERTFIKKRGVIIATANGLSKIVLSIENGRIKRAESEAIDLEDIPEDPEIIKIIERYRAELAEKRKEVLGRIDRPMSFEGFFNLIADAIRDYADTDIGLVFLSTKPKRMEYIDKGTVTLGDIYRLSFPPSLKDSIVKAEVSGEELLELLEWSLFREAEIEELHGPIWRTGLSGVKVIAGPNWKSEQIRRIREEKIALPSILYRRIKRVEIEGEPAIKDKSYTLAIQRHHPFYLCYQNPHLNIKLTSLYSVIEDVLIDYFRKKKEVSVETGRIISLDEWSHLLHDIRNTARSDLKIKKGVPKEVYQVRCWSEDGLCADVDSDLKAEIFVRHIDGGVCAISDKKILWHNPEIEATRLQALCDIDSDRDIELVCSNSEGVYILSAANGELIYFFPTKTKHFWFFEKPYSPYYVVPADLDLDGNCEFIITAFHKLGSALHLVDNKGKELWKFRFWGNSYYNLPAIADIDKDGRSEILIHAHDYTRNGGCAETLFCISSKGKLLWKYEFSPSEKLKKIGVNDFGYISTIIADFDKDGELEIFSGTDTGVYLLDKDGNLIWRQDTGVLSCGKVRIWKGEKSKLYKPPHPNCAHYLVEDSCCGDINSDGYLDVVLGLSSDYDAEWREHEDGMVEHIKVYNVISRNKARAISGKDGSILWEFEGERVELGRMGYPILCDIRGDGNLDVILISSDNSIYAIEGESGRMLWRYKLKDGQSPARVKIADVDGDFCGELIFCSVKESLPEDIEEKRKAYREMGDDRSAVKRYFRYSLHILDFGE